LILRQKYPKAVNNGDQKISIKHNKNEELIINGIPDNQKQAKLMSIIRILQKSNMSLDFFSN
jgi:hypothetical protein